MANGVLSTNVTVLETYRNDGPGPVHLQSSVLVQGGSLWLVANENSTLSYDLGVGTFPFGEFNGFGELRGSPSSFNATFTESGDSLGATQAAPGDKVRVPFRQHEVDLGLLLPGETVDYFYSLTIAMRAPILEIAQWQFVDPGNLGALARVTAAPVAPPPAVPVPATLGLLVTGLLTLAAARRRQG